MPPNRKVVLKRRRRPDRKALVTFAGLFTVIRIEQMLAEQSPANEVGRVVRASGSPPARQRGYGRRGRICVTRPALVLAGRSGWGAFASSTQLTGASNQSLRLGSIPTAAVHNAGGHAVVAVWHELVPNLPCRETIPVNGR